MTTTTHFTSKKMESKISKAMAYLEANPGTPVVSVARDFRVPRSRLRCRFEGRPPKKGLPAVNMKLLLPKKVALCHYIDRLGKVNLAVRPEFVTDVE